MGCAKQYRGNYGLRTAIAQTSKASLANHLAELTVAMSGSNAPNRFEIVLFRRNGRFVKSVYRPSKYSAKQLQNQWDDKYENVGGGYYTEIRPVADAVSGSPAP